MSRQGRIVIGLALAATACQLSATAPRADPLPAPAPAVTPAIPEALRVSIGKVVVVVPRLETKGTRLDAAELRHLLALDSPEPVESRLDRFSADEITAPLIKIYGRGGGAADGPPLLLHDVVLADIQAGRIGRLTVGRITVSDDRPPKPFTVESGALTALRIDLPLVAKIAKASRTDANEPLRPLVDSLALDASRFKDPDVEISLGSFRLGAVRARPPLTSFADQNTLFETPDASRTDEQRRRLSDAGADDLRNSSLDHVEASDLAIGKVGTDAGAFTLGRLAAEGIEPERVRTFVLERLSFASAAVGLSMDRFSLEGYDGSRMLDFLASHGFAADPEGLRLHTNQLTPDLAKVELQGLRVEAPADDLNGNAKAGTRHIVDVPRADLTTHKDADDTRHTAASVRVVYDIAPDAVASGLKSFAQAGFGHLDVTTAMSLAWRSATREAILDALSVSARDLAAVSVGGVFSFVDTGSFEPGQSAERSAEAARRIRFREAHAELTDNGLAAKLWPVLGAQAGVNPLLLKAEAKGQAQVFLLKLFGDTPTYARVSQALSAFIDDPKTLRVSVRSPDAISLGAIADAPDPRALLDRLTIDATATR